MEEQRSSNGDGQGEEVAPPAHQLDPKLGLSRLQLFFLGSPSAGRVHSVRVSWEFSSPCTLLDWIGLYRAEERDPLAFMDYRGFGVCGPKKGSVEWPIREDLMAASAMDKRNNNNGDDGTRGDAEEQQQPAKQLQFRYFDGLTGAVKARSPPLLVYSDAQLVISALQCQGGLRHSNGTRGGGRFYAKLSCSGSASRVYRTPLSANGQWPSLNFLFPADRSAELRVRVKQERMWPAIGGKAVGEANIPVLDLLEGADAENGRQFCFLLRPQCQQPLLLKCRLVPSVRQPIAETMHTLGLPSAAAAAATASAAADSANGNLMSRQQQQQSPMQLSASTSSSAGGASSASSASSSACNAHQQIIRSFCSTSSSTSSSSFIGDRHENLPPGWERRVDGQGRIFYVDHIRQRTAWTAPLILEKSAVGDGGEDGMSARAARRTVLGAQPAAEVEQSADLANGNAIGQQSEQQNQQQQQPMALQFLLRDDLFGQQLQANQLGLRLYNGSPFLKHIVQRIRREPNKFWQFERNRELITFVNAFADQTQPLPIGWQMARQSGQPLFVDHANRWITAFDPRLPEMPRSMKGCCKSAPPVRRKKQQPTGPRNGQQRQQQSGRRNSRVDGGGIWSWELAEKADQIQALLAERCPELAQRVNAKLRLIGRMGELALLRYANDPDLVRAISLLEQLEADGQLGDLLEGKPAVEEPKSQFELVLAKFHAELEKAGYGRGPTRIRFRLRRDRLMEDAFQKILAANPAHLRKCQMTVSFAEEEGLDYGGPSRELFFLLSRELFHPRHGLFEYAGTDSHRVQISPMSKFVDHHLRWMELCGRILGLALVHRCLLDCFFTRPFYKMLAQIPLDLEDLREMDPQIFHSLGWLRRNRITDDLDLTFCVTEELAGQITERELVPRGKSLPVTEQNKEKFVGLMLRWRVERGVQQQSEALLRGLQAVLDRDLLVRLFDADQLELALSGSVQIDIGDWERNTEYRGGYHPKHVLIRWFWQSVQEMRNADRLRLLQFVTGSSSVPFEGFKGLRGSNGAKRFCIERWGTEESLPRAHTCFNRLDLPAYPNRQTLLAKLMLAITESSSYAIE